MQFEREYKVSPNIPVKIMIAELLPDPSQRTFRSVLSPVIQYVPTVQPKYGIFHTAIVIGPYLLEWTDGQVCVPRIVADNAALLACDVTILKNVPLSEIVDTVRKIFVRQKKNSLMYMYIYSFVN